MLEFCYQHNWQLVPARLCSCEPTLPNKTLSIARCLQQCLVKAADATALGTTIAACGREQLVGAIEDGLSTFDMGDAGQAKPSLYPLNGTGRLYSRAGGETT